MNLFLKEKFMVMPPEPQLPEEAREHLARWHMPEQGFRNYWYPVMLASELRQASRSKRRLLGEDIAFWRDGGKVNAIADRCPHRGASISGRTYPISRLRHCELPVPRLDLRWPRPTPRLHSRRTEFAHGRESQNQVISGGGTVRRGLGLDRRHGTGIR